jgi:iron complex transport system substrate-binding protein
MELDLNYNYPQRIICLTEESVETLYLLGKEELISGVSAFVKRPVEAQKLPKVSFFTSSNYKKIMDIRPDLVIGHSDIQKDIARDLIEKGLNVFVANHRSISEILQYIRMLSRMVSAEEKGDELINKLLSKINEAKEFTQSLHYRPKVYFEEWDEPMISAIKWVSELIELCGGVDINANKSSGTLAKDRFVTHEQIIDANPDIIFGCWCGKKVKIDSIKNRDGYSEINAVKNNQVFELAPEIFLQPGPAPLIDGIDIIINYFKKFEKGNSK